MTAEDRISEFEAHLGESGMAPKTLEAYVTEIRGFVKFRRNEFLFEQGLTGGGSKC